MRLINAFGNSIVISPCTENTALAAGLDYAKSVVRQFISDTADDKSSVIGPSDLV